MALFKILKGLKANLPTEKHEGYVYLTTDDMKFHIDTDADTRAELNAAKADRLIANNVGSATKPVYFENGVPIAGTHTIASDVPANAKFSDTTYSEFVGSGVDASSGLVPAPPTTAGTTKFLREDGTWEAPPAADVPAATTTSLGVVQIGQNITISDAGVIDITGTDVCDALTYVPLNSGAVDITGASVDISTAQLSLGSTDSTAFRGDYGQVAYDHALTKGAALSGLGTFTSNAHGHITGFTAGGHSTATITVGNTAAAPKITLNSNGDITGVRVMGAVWNDYAEYRQSAVLEPGRCIVENGDDTLSLAAERMMPGANIVSDTFGFAIGKTESAQCPIAVSGRVLAYPYEDRECFNPGDAVCSGPNGTVSLMTRDEIRNFPERIIGTVSAVPHYETWGENNIPVNGRIWIRL